MLFVTSRNEYLHRLVIPHLEKWGIFISDRFAVSTYAYQWGGRYNFNNSIKEWLDVLHKKIVGDYWSDKTFLFDISIECMFERFKQGQRNPDDDWFENEQAEFHKRVKKAYLEIAKRNPKMFYILNGELPIENLAQQVFSVVDKLYVSKSGIHIEGSKK